MSSSDQKPSTSCDQSPNIRAEQTAPDEPLTRLLGTSCELASGYPANAAASVMMKLLDVSAVVFNTRRILATALAFVANPSDPVSALAVSTAAVRATTLSH